MERASGMHPSAVALRQEVNFCCPVPECRNSILTYHHFDPPWRDRQHNDIAGMIALCHQCHQKAEGGAWTKTQLRNFKMQPKSPNTIRQLLGFPEPGRKPLYRLGGNYVLSSSTILQLADVPILTERWSSSGLLSFNFLLLDHRNKLLLSVFENSVSVEMLDAWDCFFNTHVNHLVFRKKAGTVALELRIRRASLDELREQLQRDSAAIEKMRNSSLLQRVSGVGGVELNLSLDSISWHSAALQMVSEECIDSDGKVCLIDIVRANLYANGRWLVVRNGIEAGSMIAHSFVANNGGCAFNLAGKPVLQKYYNEMKESFSIQDAMIVQREELLREMQQYCSPSAREIYMDAVGTFPASMAVASGMQAVRIGQRNPNFIL